MEQNESVKKDNADIAFYNFEPIYVRSPEISKKILHD